MNLQTFRAPTMGEALTQVKSVMGTDAIILHTRTLQMRRWLGLRRREIIEITAGKGLNVGARNLNRAAPRKAAVNPAATYGRPGLRSAGDAPRNAVEGSRQLMETPAANSAALLGLTQEMTSLKYIVKDLITQTRHQQSPNIPEDLFDYYMQLVGNDVAQELACEIVKSLQKQLRPEHLAQPQIVQEKLAEQLEKLLPTSGPLIRKKTAGPHVVALIGPTGVGKTTTLAKLAANLKLREKHRVGLITMDTYRIAAVDQLKRYADSIGSPLRVVHGADELRDAQQAMSDFDFLLIDTAGRSPNDAL